MNQITLQAYAVKHKLSVFNVIKMIKSNKLKSEEIEENGKKVLYIILDDESEEFVNMETDKEEVVYAYAEKLVSGKVDEPSDFY